MPNNKPPRVVYRHDTKTGVKIRVGYLITGADGRDYLAAQKTDVLENMKLARLPQLDSSLLVPQQDIESGEQIFLYQGDIPSPHTE